MSNQIEFNETEILRIQVANLLQRVGDLEADKSRLHAMLQVLAQKHAANSAGDQNQPPGSTTLQPTNN